MNFRIHIINTNIVFKDNSHRDLSDMEVEPLKGKTYQLRKSS